MTGFPPEFTELTIRHSVIVNEGSGVLIQPASSEYSYIFTAKHVLTEERHISGEDVIVEIETTNIKIIDHNDQVLTVIEQYLHETLDAAILKVDYQEDLPITAYSNYQVDPPILRLWGFPKKRRLSSSFRDRLQCYNLNLIPSTGPLLTYRNESFADYSDVEGCSGCGVFYLDASHVDKRIFVAGIECSMPGEAVRMQHDHIQCVPIYVFNEIIEHYKLAELKPLHLTGFQHLRGDLFPKKYYENSVLDFQHQQILPFLNSIRTHCNRSLAKVTFTPGQLLQDYPDKFTVGGRPSYELEDENCWSKFLELLTLLSLVNDRGFDQLFPDEIFKEFKVVYIRSKKSWFVHFRDVLNLDTTALDPGGKIVLFLDDTPGKCAVIAKEDIDSCVRDISNTSDNPDLIDAAQSIQKNGHTMIHWVNLHDELIFKRRSELQNIESAKAKKNKIQELYGQYLKFKEVINE
ncbi:ABC-three component system protein [Coraliomargarita sp. W4R72]